MKFSLLFFCQLIILFSISICFSQVPQGINYQGVARDNSGNILPNQLTGLRISLHSGSGNGPTVYQETHAATTNNFGLFNIQIGGGIVVSGTFNTISWGTSTWFVQVEMDATGGTNYQDMGASQLLSVPYALYAETSSSTLSGAQGPTGPQGPQGLAGVSGCCDIISVGDMVVVYTDQYAYGFSQDQSSTSDQPHPDDNAGQWTSIALNDTVVGVDASEKQIVIYTNTYAYGFSQDQSSTSTQPNPDDNPGQWTSIALTGTPLGSFHSQKQVVVYTTSYAYGFSQDQSSTSSQPHPDDNVGQWTSISLTGTPLGGKASAKNIVIYTTNYAYGFSQNQSSTSSQPFPDDNPGQWTTTSLIGTPKGIVNTK